MANAIIKRGNLHKSFFEIVEDTMDEIGINNKKDRDMIYEFVKGKFGVKENDENKLKKFIQDLFDMLE